MTGRTVSMVIVNNTQNGWTECGVGDDILLAATMNISRPKLKRFITVLLGIVYVTDKEIISGCTIINALTIDNLQPLIVALVKTVIQITNVNHKTTIDPCRTSSALTITTTELFIAVMITFSIVCVNGMELLALYIITVVIMVILMLVLSTAITMAIMTLLRHKLELFIAVLMIGIAYNIISVMVNEFILVYDNIICVFYALMCLLFVTMQVFICCIKIYPCTIRIEEFIELLDASTAKPFISVIQVYIDYENGKELLILDAMDTIISIIFYYININWQQNFKTIHCSIFAYVNGDELSMEVIIIYTNKIVHHYYNRNWCILCFGVRKLDVTVVCVNGKGCIKPFTAVVNVTLFRLNK